MNKFSAKGDDNFRENFRVKGKQLERMTEILMRIGSGRLSP